jgi:LacI family transcriptional regulator
VIPGAEKIGYLSAFLLEELMNGRSSKPRLTVVAPIGVASRQSTEIVSLDDRELAQALLFVQKNALSGISVNDILKNVPISRTALEKGFQLILGRTPKAEIRHLQVLEATRLLQTTNLRIHEIAERCGFKHPEYMSVVFKRETGKSPGMIREKG